MRAKTLLIAILFVQPFVVSLLNHQPAVPETFDRLSVNG
jgi:hypothetical protein